MIYVKGDNEIVSKEQTATRNLFLYKLGLEERWFYNGKHVQCAVISTLCDYGQRFSVLVFRGTQWGISNWLFNLDIVLSSWPSGGCVHKGFKLLDNLSEPLFYTSHSLGGALAVLAASLKKPDAVYIFGSPRIGKFKRLRCTAVLVRSTRVSCRSFPCRL